MRILTNVNIDWLRWRWHSLALSWLIILGGVGLIVTRGLPLGIDFTGGTALVVQFATDVPLQQVRSAVEPLPGEEVVQQFDDPSKRQVLIRLAQVETAEQGTSLEEGARQVMAALQTAGLPNPEIISRDLVGAVIGEDLQRKGIY